MTSRTVIRPRLSAVVYVLIVIACLAAFISLLASGTVGAASAVLPIPLLLLGVGYVTLLAPTVVFEADAVEVRNPLRTIRVPYGRVEEARTKHGFTLQTDDGPVSAWAAPPPDRLTAQRIVPTEQLRRDPRVRRDERGDITAGDAPGSPSGDAMTTLAHRLAEPSRSSDGTVERRWNRVNLTVLAVAVVAAVGLALTGLA